MPRNAHTEHRSPPHAETPSSYGSRGQPTRYCRLALPSDLKETLLRFTPMGPRGSGVVHRQPDRTALARPESARNLSSATDVQFNSIPEWGRRVGLSKDSADKAARLSGGEQAAEEVGGVLVAPFDHVGVDPQRGRGVRMS
jgi:hypothetical protein